MHRVKRSEGPKAWNRLVKLEAKFRLPITAEDYAPRIYYDVCFDSGFGFGPLRSADIFVRDQGVT